MHRNLQRFCIKAVYVLKPSALPKIVPAAACFSMDATIITGMAKINK